MTSLTTSLSCRRPRLSEFSSHVSICTAELLNFMTLLCFLPVFTSLEATITLSLIIISDILHLIGVYLRKAPLLAPNILFKMLLATLLTIATFSLNREHPDDAMSLTLWMTITVVWLIAEAHLMTAICFQYISHPKPADSPSQIREKDTPPDYDQVMATQLKLDKMELPSYADYLRLYGKGKEGVCAIDVDALEQVLDYGVHTSSSTAALCDEDPR